jgi:hypothetical protein
MASYIEKANRKPESKIKDDEYDDRKSETMIKDDDDGLSKKKKGRWG